MDHLHPLESIDSGLEHFIYKERKSYPHVVLSAYMLVSILSKGVKTLFCSAKKIMYKNIVLTISDITHHVTYSRVIYLKTPVAFVKGACVANSCNLN